MRKRKFGWYSSQGPPTALRERWRPGQYQLNANLLPTQQGQYPRQLD